MRAPRFPLHLPVRYRPIGDAAWHEGRTENISYSGVLFWADDLLQVNTPIEMRLVLPVDVREGVRPEVFCQARIVRTVPPSAAGTRPGLAASIQEYHFVRDRANAT